MLPFLITTDHHWTEAAHDAARARGATGPADLALLLMPPQYLRLLKPLMTDAGKTVDGPVAHAYVEAGRWLARCPFCDSCQVVHPDDPRWLCGGVGGCANHEVKGAYVPLVFPTKKEQREIERLLVKRSNLQHRNFIPAGAAERLHRPQLAETVADLRRENKEAGL